MRKIYAICICHTVGYKTENEKLIATDINVGDRIRVLAADIYGANSKDYLEGYDEPLDSMFFNYYDEYGYKFDIYQNIGYHVF